MHNVASPSVGEPSIDCHAAGPVSSHLYMPVLVLEQGNNIRHIYTIDEMAGRLSLLGDHESVQSCTLEQPLHIKKTKCNANF